MSVVEVPAIPREAFPSDRGYTLNALVEELALMERHIRDGSWRLCQCNLEKHLPLIAGLASEGYGFAETSQEKLFMANLRDTSRSLRERIKKREVKTQEDMDKVSDWARSIRHRIEAQEWKFEEPKTVEKLLTELQEKLKAEFSSYTNLAQIETEMADKMLSFLSDKYNVPKPKLAITEECNSPLQGMHLGVTEMETGKPRADLDRIVMCKGGLNARVLVHEFMHYLKNVRGQRQDEAQVEQMAVKEIVSKYSTGEKLLKVETSKYTTEAKRMSVSYRDVLTVYGGDLVADGVENGLEMYVDPMVTPTATLVQLKASTWINLALGIVLPVGAVMWKKIKAPLDLLLVSLGGHMVTHVADKFLKQVTPAAAVPTIVRGVPLVGGVPYSAAEVPGGAPEFYPPLYGQRVARTPVIKDHVRYQVTG